MALPALQSLAPFLLATSGGSVIGVGSVIILIAVVVLIVAAIVFFIRRRR